MSDDNGDSDPTYSLPKPTTLSELQSFSTADFREVEAFHYRGDLSKRRVVEGIIDCAAAELSWQGEANSNSLRDFWYNPTKAILEEAFPDAYGGPGTSKFNRNMSKVLSSVLSDKVKDGEITYRDLNILDDSRDREIHTDSVESDKILFVEKSSAYRKLKPLEEVYQLSLVEGSGWQATAAIEDLVRQLDTDGDKRYTVYVLSDFDPAGFGIVEDFAARTKQFGLPVKEVKRIGIKPEQVSQQALEDQKFTPGGSNIEDWLAEYGIDGQYGLELEAVGTDLEKKGRALRKLVVEEIKDDVDTRSRRAQDTASKIATKGRGAAGSVASDITSDLEDALSEAAAEIVESDVAGVTKAENTMFGMRVSVDFDTIEAIHNGEDPDVGDADPSITPRPYDDEDLHKGAYKGSTPRVRDSKAMKRHVKQELRQRIQDGDIDVQELLDL
jgi:hypothetical protein